MGLFCALLQVPDQRLRRGLRLIDCDGARNTDRREINAAKRSCVVSLRDLLGGGGKDVMFGFMSGGNGGLTS